METIESIATEIRALNEKLFKARQVAHRLEIRIGDLKRRYDQMQRDAFADRRAEELINELSESEQLSLLEALYSKFQNC